MQRRTHNSFAKFYLGENREVKMKDIDAINGAIDSPTRMDKNFTRLFDLQEFDVAGLTEKGSHRNYNHDLVGGLTKALAIDPVNGFDIYMAHILMDKTSNIMREALGSDNKAIAEVIFNRMLRNVSDGARPPPRPTNLMKYENRFKKNKFYRMSKK